jgi:hypothetical protein
MSADECVGEAMGIMVKGIPGYCWVGTCDWDTAQRHYHSCMRFSGFCGWMDVMTQSYQGFYQFLSQLFL